MTGRADLQGNNAVPEMRRWECPVHFTAWAPVRNADERPLCGRRDCGKPLALVQYVPLSVAENLAAALERIKADEGRVCERFEVCSHVGCQSSYGAWAIADEALAEYRAAYPKPV